MENLMTEHTVKFNVLASNFTSVVYGRSEGDRNSMNLILDELNSLNYKVQVVTNNDKAVLLVHHCCSIIPPSDTFLIAKCCQLIYNLVARQQVRIEGKTFLVAVDWCMESVKYCGSIVILDILHTLESLLRSSEIKEEQIHNLLGPNGVLNSLLNKDNVTNQNNDLKIESPWEIDVYTLYCIEALTSKNTLKSLYMTNCIDIFLKYLHREQAPKEDENNFCKGILASIHGLKNIIEKSADICHQYLGDLLGIIKVYMVYGLPGFLGIKPEKVYPSHLSQADMKPNKSEARNRKGIRIRRKSNSSRKKSDKGNITKDAVDEVTVDYVAASAFQNYTSDKLNDESQLESYSSPAHSVWPRTSDSDFSDSECSQAAKLHNIYARIREMSLTLLISVSKVTEKKLLFGYWTSLLPDSPKSTHTLSVITCLVNDPSPRCRMMALHVLCNMFLGSKPFLLQAEKSDRNVSSFTPFSVTLGNIIEELHRSFCTVAKAENSLPVLCQLLKCIAILIQNTPYHRLTSGLITNITCSTKYFVRHKDIKIKVAALTIIGSIVSLDQPTSEIIDLLKRIYIPKSCHTLDNVNSIKSNETTESEGGGDDEGVTSGDASNEMPWILRTCLENLGLSLTNGTYTMSKRKILAVVPVEVESLQLLAVLCINYFSTVVLQNLEVILTVLEHLLQDSDTTVCLHIGRVIEAIGKALHIHYKKSDSFLPLPLKTVVEFWQRMLSGPLLSLLQNDESGPLRSVGCNCLASIGEEAFEELPFDKRILIITLLFGCSKEKENYVQSSATRSLAVCVLFKSLRQDIHFVVDTAEAVLRSLQDESLGVRIKASWSLGNLTDALVMNRDDPESEDIPDSLYLELLKYGVKAAKDSDKVRSNAVRAIGNLLRILNDSMSKDADVIEYVKTAIQVLVENATSGSNMKIRWNACYALRNVMLTNEMYLVDFEWHSIVFPALNSLVQNFRNFKVRINAASALVAPLSRQHYGDYYIKTWEALLVGLSNADDMEDYNEYKHKDNLVNQICFGIIYLATLVQKEDLVTLGDILPYHSDLLLTNIVSYYKHVDENKREVIHAAAKRSSFLLQLEDLNTVEYSTAALLSNIFIPDT